MDKGNSVKTKVEIRAYMYEVQDLKEDGKTDELKNYRDKNEPDISKFIDNKPMYDGYRGLDHKPMYVIAKLRELGNDEEWGLWIDYIDTMFRIAENFPRESLEKLKPTMMTALNTFLKNLEDEIDKIHKHGFNPWNGDILEASFLYLKTLIEQPNSILEIFNVFKIVTRITYYRNDEIRRAVPPEPFGRYMLQSFPKMCNQIIQFFKECSDEKTRLRNIEVRSASEIGESRNLPPVIEQHVSTYLGGAKTLRKKKTKIKTKRNYRK